MNRVIHICTTEAVGHLVGRKRTYKAVKAAVLEAGRFSVFESTATMKDARLFTKLCKDPELETFDLGYPWTGVRKREAVPSAAPLAVK